MSARKQIIDALVTEIKKIDGADPYHISLYQNVEPKQIFWDEVNDYPFVCVNAGTETREYQAADFKWGFLLVSIKIYTKGERCQEDLEDVMSDIEYLLNLNHASLQFDDISRRKVADLRVLQIDTDEGVLFPIGVGEMLIQARYEVLTN